MTERDRIREGMRRMLRDDPAPAGRPGLPRLERYELGERIGEGAMAVVHRARDRELERDVAIKILRNAAVAGPMILERFRREARTVAGFAHPGIAAVYDAGEAEGSLYLVMELVEGRPLGALLEDPANRRGNLVAVLEEAARGVGAAHERGIVHRDLKPANILVSDTGHAKVVDFGIAHVVGAEVLTQAGTVMGTPLYMAPEQVKGSVDRISPRTDVYALGAILYETLTGRTPHVGGNMTEIFARIVGEETRAPQEVKPGVPRDLATVAMKALEKDPERRYANAVEFADELRRYLDGEPVRAVPVTITQRWARRVRRRPLPWITTAAAVIAIAAALAVAGRSGRELDRKALAAEVSSAYFDLALATLQPMTDLEDAWQGARPDLDRERALAEIDVAVRRAAERHPRTKVPAAWRALALCFAGRPEGERELEAACVSSADPLPDIFLARAMMARYARDAELEWAWPSGDASPAPRFVETPAMSEARSRAEAALSRALAADLWPLLDRGGEFRVYAEGATDLAARRYGPAAKKLAALAEVPLLKSEAALLHGFALYLTDRFAEAAKAWTLPASRGWPKAIFLRGLAAGVMATDAAGLAAARKDFDHLVELDWEPKRTRLFRGLIRSLEAGAREDRSAHEEAILDFDRAIEADTKNDWPWFYRARSRLVVAAMDLARGIDVSAAVARAEADYARAIEVNPGSPMNYYGRAGAREMRAGIEASRGGNPLPDLERALADLDTALELNAKFTSAREARTGLKRRILELRGGEEH